MADKHEHKHEKGCGCGCGHEHKHEEECGCGCGHEHKHEKECGCGCGHEHKHEKECGCGCGHEHMHEKECGCGCEHGHHHEEGCGCGCGHDHGENSVRNMGIRLCVAAALFAAALFVPIDGILRALVFAVPYIVIGWDVLYRAVRNIARGRVFDECFLMTVASLGAFIVGEYAEGVAVMLFYQLGELFTDVASDRTRDAIAKLTDVRPDRANVENGGAVVEMDARNVEIGSVIVIKPGERVPLDGCVISGASELDQSALTGESLPRGVAEGDRVLAGCVNLRGVIRVRVEKGYGESEAARILELVESAGERKARSEQFITRFARVYTPVVCILAVIIALIPPIFVGNIAEWVHRALIFLVVSCPCALVISVPLTFFAGIGALSRRGVLVKGGCYMDQLAAADVFVFDKTGTLTEGRFRVKEVYGNAGRDEIIALAAHAETYSDHPLARAVCREYGKETDRASVADVEELAGMGVKAVVGGRKVLVGNMKLMEAHGVDVRKADGTVLYVAADGGYVGTIVLADEPKANAGAALAGLKALGARRLVMLTGDAESSAAEVAEATGITEHYAGLMPGDKADRLEELIKERGNGHAVVFVGDGINDAPSLALADVGIAMGGAGSDAAIEAADVVLMDDEPGKLVTAVKGARRTLAIVKQNIGISLGVKIGVMALGAIGIAGMWAAVFADVGVCILAVVNASRAMKIRG